MALLLKGFTPCSSQAAANPAVSSGFLEGGAEAQRRGSSRPGTGSLLQNPFGFFGCHLPCPPFSGCTGALSRLPLPRREPAPALPGRRSWVHPFPGKEVPGSIPSPGRLSRAPSPPRLGEAAAPSSRRRSLAGAALEPRSTPGSAERGNPQHLWALHSSYPPSWRFKMFSVKKGGKKLWESHFTFSRRLQGPGAPAGVTSSLLPSCIYTVFSCDSLHLNYELRGGETTAATPRSP